jgi:acyl carrier protein
MDTLQIENAIRAYLRDELSLPEEELARDARLVRNGLLDSVNLVQLATHLERAFEIEIPDQDIDGEHLDSIEMIAAYIEKKRVERKRVERDRVERERVERKQRG